MTSSTKNRQFKFWNQFNEFVSQNYPELKLKKPKPQHWLRIGVSRSDCYIVLTILSRENQLSCELYIPHSKELYKDLLLNRGLIEKQISLDRKVDWQELPEKKGCRIRVL